MATYGYSTPYMGQRQPTLPPGYMEAATAPGRNIAAGIQQFAAGLGQAIEKYRANKAETEAATQTYETLVGMTNQALASDPQYQALQQYYETGQLPAGVTEADLGRFANKVQADRTMLNKMMGIGDKFGDMSLAKKKAAIGDMAMVLGQYQQRTEGDLKRRQMEMAVRDLERKEKAAVDIERLTGYAAGLPTTRTVQEMVPQQVETQGPPSVSPEVQGPPALAPEYYDALRRFSQQGEAPNIPEIQRQIEALRPQLSPEPALVNVPALAGGMGGGAPSPSMAARTIPESPRQTAYRVAQASSKMSALERQLAEANAQQSQRTEMPKADQFLRYPEQPSQQPQFPAPATVEQQVSKTESVPYEDLRRGLAQFAASQRMAPEAFQAMDKVLEAAAGLRKPMEVDQKTLPGGAQVIRVDGKVEVIPPPKPIDGKPLTDAQGKAIQFAAGMRANNETVNRLIAGGYAPGGLTVSDWTPERIRTADRKSYEFARDRWVENFLRGRSGAAVTPEEYPAARVQYFPVAGDSPAVIKEKALAREEQYRGELAKGGDHSELYLQQILGATAAAPTQEPQTRKSSSGTTYQIQKY